MTGIIYLDGADGQGKTTLAHEILKRAGGKGRIIHQHYRWKNKKDGILFYHFAALHRAVKLSQRELVIIDRHWITEEVYARVYRGGTTWPHYGRMIDRVMLKHAALTVICQSEPKLGAERHRKLHAEREEMYAPDERMLAVGQVFWDAWNGNIYEFRGHDTYLGHLASTMMPLPRGYAGIVGMGLSYRPDFLHYSIESNGSDVDFFIKVLFDRLRERQREQYQPALDPTKENVLGYLPTAKYLFVGDQLNPKTRALRWPFFDYGNSSLYLAKSLHKIGFDETEGMYTNAYGSSDHHIQKLLELKPELRVVALGSRAASELDSADVDFYRVDHPQYARRFDAHGDYHERLRKALNYPRSLFREH